MCVCVCVNIYIYTHTYIYIYIYIYKPTNFPSPTDVTELILLYPYTSDI